MKDYLYTIIMLSILVFILQSCGLVHAKEIDLAIISKIESSNNPKAYNKYSKASGLYQITPVCLQDYKNYHKDSTYTINDMFVPSRGYSVASWYLNKRIPQLLKHYKKSDTLENRLIAYNCGIACVDNPLPKETKNYINKYKKEIK